MARVELRQVFVEGAEHFQHGVFVGEEHVAPHGRIGRGDAGEIAKAAGREFEHFRARDFRQFIRRADDRVGDQMRQVAGDRQHQVVVRGRHGFDVGAEQPPERGKTLDRGGIGASRRRENAPATDEQRSAKPASGPEFSVPATGCAGTKCTSGGRCGAIVATTAALTEPTSDTVAPGARWGPISAATAPHAPTGTHTITRSAPAAAAALFSATWSASPSSATRCRVAAERAVATISRTTPCRACCARDRGADKPHADQRQAVEQGRALFGHGITGLWPKNL